MPAWTAIGNEQLPTTIAVAIAVARPRRHELNRGLFHPIDWNRLHDAVEQVDAEGDVGDDVQDRDRQLGEALVEVVVHGAADEVGVEPAPREVGQVVGEEQQDDDSGPAHRAAGEVGRHVVPRRLVPHRPGPAVDEGERVGGVEVQHERDDEDDAHRPERDRARQEGHQELAQELAVVVDLLRAEVHLEVADHVGDHVAHADQPGDRHHVLLADRGGVQVEQEGLALPRRRPRGPTPPLVRPLAPSARTLTPRRGVTPKSGPDRNQAAPGSVQPTWGGLHEQQPSCSRSVRSAPAPSSGDDDAAGSAADGSGHGTRDDREAAADTIPAGTDDGAPSDAGRRARGRRRPAAGSPRCCSSPDRRSRSRPGPRCAPTTSAPRSTA